MEQQEVSGEENGHSQDLAIFRHQLGAPRKLHKHAAQFFRYYPNN